MIHHLQEQEEPNDSEVEPVEDYQQQNPKVNRESTSETETHSPVALTSADEEAVNKVAEKIDTLRMAPRQVRMSKHHKEKQIL